MRGLEPTHQFLTLSSWPVRSFDPVVQPFVYAVIRIRCKITDRLEVASQFVRDHNARFAEFRNQSLQKAPGGLSIPP